MLLIVSLVLPGAVFGQQRPLRTDDAELLETGRVRFGLGVDFLQNQRYPLSGLRGDLTRIGVAGIQIGVGDYAEFQISGVVQEVLSISERTEPVVPPTFSGDSTSDFGNIILGTKLKLVGEKEKWPAMAFKFAVELPNANQAGGLGNDETNFYSSILFKKHFGRTRILADVGFAILGSPVTAGVQTDPLTYGIATIVPLHETLSLVVEVSGRRGPEGRIGNENRSRALAGIQLRTGAVRWDLSGIAGLTRFDPKSGFIIGATYEFQAFNRNGQSFTIRK
jgi:hypothetical protein